MQELFNKHMIGTFAVEIAVLTIALSLIGFVAMRLRAQKTGRAHHAKQYVITALFALFLSSVLSLTLTPIGDANSVSNPELYYPRFYVGWSWQQAWELTRGMGLRRFATTVLHRGLPALGPARYGSERLRTVDLHRVEPADR